MSRRKEGSALPLLEAFPFQFGNFLDQLLHNAIVADGLPDAFLPILGNTDLAGFSLLALHEINRAMQLATGAMAGGFAALAGTLGESAAENPAARSELGDSGAEVPLDGGELGAAGGFAHFLYNYYIQEERAKASPNNNANLLRLSAKHKHTGNQMFPRSITGRCGIAGV